MEMKVFLLIFLTLVKVTLTMHSSKDLEGYPSGYLSDCPKTNKKVIMSKKSLKNLGFTTQGKGHFITAKRTRYNYYQMKDLLRDPQINLKRKTLVYVGGYLDSPAFPFSGSLVYEYKKLDYNVFSIDMHKFVTVQYPLAAIYMKTVGKHVAEMLANLVNLGMNPKTIELIGLSLGGQTVSFIAKNFREITGMNITRITALDPAGPCFRNLGPEDRLDQSDADFIEVINTNIDGFGMAAPVGHVNFYVNGGEYQPGDLIWMPCNVLCSHIRSFTLWLSALKNPYSFIGMQCDSVQDARMKRCYDRTPRVTNLVGYETDKSREGIFFLATTNNYPYYLGEKGLKKENEFFGAMMKKIVESDDMIM